ncbi:MAG: DUF4197 domain-containing protein [Chitinophagales bacterium]
MKKQLGILFLMCFALFIQAQTTNLKITQNGATLNKGNTSGGKAGGSKANSGTTKKPVAKPTTNVVKPKPASTPSNNTNNTNNGGGGRPGANTNNTPVNNNSNNNTNNNNNGGGGRGGTVVDDIVKVVTDNTNGGFSEADAANAIKQALISGITNGVKNVAIKDGYYGNAMIKIPFPAEAQVVSSTLNTIGMSSLVDNMVVQLNRAAEQSATEATPIFLNSISQLTISDALNIVGNQQPDAATQFLKRTTTEALVAAFRPKVKSVLDKTMTTSAWSQVMSTYNQVPFVQPINPDLTDYVTRKALDGLFYMVAQEESKIRKDPMARTSDLLKRVFGGVANTGNVHR